MGVNKNAFQFNADRPFTSNTGYSVDMLEHAWGVIV